MEITPLERDRKIQSYRASAREEVDTGAGLLPRGEIPFTFLQTAQQRQAQLIPGWTPTTTFYDDFTIVPGGVGSSWTNTLSGTATISAPSVGVARFTPGTGTAHSMVTSITVPAANTGRFYSVAKIQLATIASASGGVGVRGNAGSPAGELVAVRASVPAAAPFFRLASSQASVPVVTSPVEIDVSTHTLELWWNGDGYSRGAADGCVTMALRCPTFTGTPNPYLFMSGTTAIWDVTDYVCMV
jgi:hypothetical protein